MKFKQLILLPMAMASHTALAQPAPELDITMQVLGDGQTPAGLINRLELPPPEFFNPTEVISELPESEPDDAIVEQATTASGDVEQTVTDSVRESLSIDGVNNDEATTDGSINVNIPATVNNLIDDTLPLQESLQDSLDNTLNNPLDGTVGDALDDTLDSDVINDTVEETTETVDDIVDNLGDTTADTVDSVTDSVDDVLDATTDTVADSSNDLLDGTTSTVSDTVELNDLSEELPEQLQQPESVLEDSLDSDLLEDPVESPVQDIEAEALSPDGALDDTLNDLNDSLPGI